MELRSTARLTAAAVQAGWPHMAPPLARASMTPRPWTGVARGLRRSVRGRSPGGRRAAGPAAMAAWADAARRRRAMLLACVVGSSLLATLALLGGERAPQGALHAAFVVLFALLFAWVGAGFFTALMGLWVELRGDRHALEAPAAGTPIDRAARTAIVMPICNEDVATVFAGLRATCRSLAATGASRLFDIYVLSDTSDPALRDAELRAWQQLRDDLGDASGRVFYRLRRRRTKRKAGNVADFCRRWGRNYRYMVVLDADSVMSGDCLISLVRLMEAHPRAGIVQTAPRVCGHASTHARAQQFASRVSGRLFAAGLAYWQLGESHYWGHNAILRVEPFMRHCALAPLRGRGGLSGEIMSHDFVEAALMRRAGWEVWLAPGLDGSYEQQPPNLLEELGRDRRWCQGNLQNARLIAEPGLRPVHRAMFATGAMAYLASPLWLAFVMLGAALTLGSSGVAGAWTGTALTLSALTLAMLLLPRALGVVLVLARGEQKHYGGGARLAAGALLEALLSIWQAPLRMVAHTTFVLGALTGLRLDWKSPARDAAAIGWRDAARCIGGVGLLAALLLGLAAGAGHAALAWQIAPLLLPLVLAVPLVVWSSRTGPGRWLQRRGLMLLPEEVQTPRVLDTAATRAARHAAAPPPRIALAPVVIRPASPPRHRRPVALAPALRAAAAIAGLAVPVTTPWAPSLVAASAPPIHHWAAAAPIVAESLLPQRATLGGTMVSAPRSEPGREVAAARDRAGAKSRLRRTAAAPTI